MENIRFFIRILFPFLVVEFSIYLKSRVFVMHKNVYADSDTDSSVSEVKLLVYLDY